MTQENLTLVTRADCKSSMERINQRIDEIKESQIKMCECVERIEKFGDDMHKLMYGNNGNEGFIIITKIQFTKLFERIGLHTKIIITTILAIITGFVGMIINFYHQK